MDEPERSADRLTEVQPEGRAASQIEKNEFNLNISRYISTAVGEEEIDLAQTHADLVEIEKRIQAATARHNAFLRELGLAPLPSEIAPKVD